MTFYKVHASKFKASKVLFVPDQFTEIGPDAFVQTNFDIIVLSDCVTSISEHAFSKVNHCSILIPSSVVEIDSYAFDGMGEGNIIFCKTNSIAHNFCLEQNIEYSNDIDLCIKNANLINQTDGNTEHQLTETEELTIQLIKKQAEQQAQAIINEALAQAENIKNEMHREADKIMKEACEQADLIRTTAIKDAQNIKADEKIESIDMIDPSLAVTQETNRLSGNNNDCKMVEFDQPEDKCDINQSYNLFVEQFGLPPEVEKFSPICYEWQNQISQMETQDIINHFNSDDYCDEYKYFCYMELKNRFMIDSFEVDNSEFNSSINNDDTNNQQNDIESEQSEKHDGIISDKLHEYECISKYHFEWMEQLRDTPTEEIINRYNSADYNEEYKFLCYQELVNRQDLEGFSVEDIV